MQIRSQNVQENNIYMLVPFSMIDEHLNCCLIKMIKMADLIPFLKNPYLKFGLLKNYEKNSSKCSASNDLQVYVILESCRINFGDVH